MRLISSTMGRTRRTSRSCLEPKTDFSRDSSIGPTIEGVSREGRRSEGPAGRVGRAPWRGDRARARVSLNRSGPMPGIGPRGCPGSESSNFLHARGLVAALTRSHLALHFFSLVERSESAPFDGGEVHVHFLSLQRDEAIPFVIVEPLHGATRHGRSSLAV